MKVYEVFPEVSGPGHVAVAKNESEAIEVVVNYLNRFQTGHLYETSEFYASCINGEKFSEPMVINQEMGLIGLKDK